MKWAIQWRWLGFRALFSSYLSMIVFVRFRHLYDPLANQQNAVAAVVPILFYVTIYVGVRAAKTKPDTQRHAPVFQSDDFCKVYVKVLWGWWFCHILTRMYKISLFKFVYITYLMRPLVRKKKHLTKGRRLLFEVYLEIYLFIFELNVYFMRQLDLL